MSSRNQQYSNYPSTFVPSHNDRGQRRSWQGQPSGLSNASSFLHPNSTQPDRPRANSVGTYPPGQTSTQPPFSMGNDPRASSPDLQSVHAGLNISERIGQNISSIDLFQALPAFSHVSRFLRGAASMGMDQAQTAERLTSVFTKGDPRFKEEFLRKIEQMVEFGEQIIYGTDPTCPKSLQIVQKRLGDDITGIHQSQLDQSNLSRDILANYEGLSKSLAQLREVQEQLVNASVSSMDAIGQSEQARQTDHQSQLKWYEAWTAEKTSLQEARTTIASLRKELEASRASNQLLSDELTELKESQTTDCAVNAETTETAPSDSGDAGDSGDSQFSWMATMLGV